MHNTVSFPFAANINGSSGIVPALATVMPTTGGGSSTVAWSSDSLTAILTTLNATSAIIEASGVISPRGLVLASLLPDHIDQDRAAALSAGLLSFAGDAASSFARGNLEQVLIQGAQGHVLFTGAGKAAILAVLTKPYDELEDVFRSAEHAAEEIFGLLGG